MKQILLTPILFIAKFLILLIAITLLALLTDLILVSPVGLLDWFSLIISKLPYTLGMSLIFVLIIESVRFYNKIEKHASVLIIMILTFACCWILSFFIYGYFNIQTKNIQSLNSSTNLINRKLGDTRDQLFIQELKDTEALGIVNVVFDNDLTSLPELKIYSSAQLIEKSIKLRDKEILLFDTSSYEKKTLINSKTFLSEIKSDFSIFLNELKKAKILGLINLLLFCILSCASLFAISFITGLSRYPLANILVVLVFLRFQLVLHAMMATSVVQQFLSNYLSFQWVFYLPLITCTVLSLFLVLFSLVITKLVRKEN